MARRTLSVLAVAAVALGSAAAIASTPASAETPTVHTSKHSPSRAQADRKTYSGTPSISAASSAARHAKLEQLSKTITATVGTKVDPELRAGDGRTVGVTVSGRSGEAAVRAVGGKVVAEANGEVSATVAKSALSRLGAASGVTRVGQPVKAVPLATSTSEGVAASNANAWQSSAVGNGGAGVNVAVVDAGFKGLADAVANGDLPAGTVVTEDNCADVDGTDHGTAVAEIVHQQAPGATLHLYCVDDNVALNAAANDIIAGNQIVSCSLGFPGDGRGDGTGSANSAAAAVAKIRKAGLLWVNSAGNSGVDHWSGTLADADNDKIADLNGSANTKEFDVVDVPGTSETGSSAAAEASIILRFDQWPTSSSRVALAVFGFQCADADCESGSDLDNGEPTIVDQTAGTAPVIGLGVSNASEYAVRYQVYVLLGSGFPKVRYDLDYEGEVANSYLSVVNPARAAAGSVTSPADSPYALAVGAANVGADGTARGTLERFSSQGPTVDSRTKPEITGWDGVSSPVYGPASTNPNVASGFYGTSAAAPHVAGAAALVKAADPGLDAAGIQRVLEDRASRGTGSGITPKPYVPPLDTFGSGLLTLGSPPASSSELEASGSRYTPVTPNRVLDTRTTTGGHKGRVGVDGKVTVPLPGLPADADSVAINLTGVNASQKTFLTAYTGGTPPPTSNLNLAPSIDATAAVFAVVKVARASAEATPTITIRNAGGTVDIAVDVLGYFGTGTEIGRLTSLSQPKRVLDTRTATGGHQRVLKGGESLVVDPAVAAGATAVVVNLTAVSPAGKGFFGASAACSGEGFSATSLLNYNSVNRANLAIVPLNADGRFCMRNAGVNVHALVDVVGYMSPSSSGAEFFSLSSSRRIVDTRTGNGGYGRGRASAPFTARAVGAFTASGVGVVPSTATALLTGVVEASATGPSFLALVPGTTGPSSATSNLLFTANRVVANAAVVGLSGKSFSVYNSANTVQAAVDVSGYFAPAGE